jgi:uncharacterized protein DUF1775
MNAEGSLRSIIWRGRTRADGLATLRFLASTPKRAGAITWKAVQTYRDGATVRWIGSAESQDPVATTIVSSSAPRERAGGHGARGHGLATAPAAAAENADDPDWLARGLGLAALLTATATAMITIRRCSP